MSKDQIDSILIANSYLTKCKCESDCVNKTELARKYLSTKIRKALRRENNYSFFKALLILISNIY